MLSDEEIELLSKPAEAEDVDSHATSAARSSVEQASYEDPDVYANDLRLAKEAGISIDIVRHNKPEIERQVGLSKNDVQSLLGNSPELTSWLETQDNANIAYDDIPTLSNISKLTQEKPWFDMSFSAFENLAETIGIGVSISTDALAMASLNADSFAKQGYADHIAKLRESGQIEEALAFEEELAQSQEKTKAIYDEYEQSFREGSEKIQSLTPKNMTIMGSAARSAAQSVAEMALPLIVTRLSRGRINATAPLLTGKASATAYGEAVTEGEMSHDDATRYATLIGAAEYVGEKLGTPALEKLLGGVSKDQIGSVIAKAVAGEVVGENLTTLAQSAIDVGHEMDEELANASSIGEMIEIQGKRQLVTTLSSLMVGGGLSGPSAAIGSIASTKEKAKNEALIKTVENRMQSQAAQDWLDDQIFLAQSSKTNERSAEEFESYINSLDPDSETRVFLPADVVSELETIPEYLQGQLDGSGADVTMELGKFLTDFAKDESLLATVRPHVKVHEKFLTQNDIENKTDNDQVKRLIENAQKTADVESEANDIMDQITQQLVDTGRQRTPEAILNAQVLKSALVAKQAELASRGIDQSIKEVFDDFGLSIVGPSVDLKALPDSTVILDQENPVYADAPKAFDKVRDDFMERIPETATTEEVMSSLDTFRSDVREFVKALDREDWMGYDSPREAVEGLLSENLDSVEIRPRLKKALGRMVDAQSKRLSQSRTEVAPDPDFGIIEITRTRQDEAGNTIEVTEKAKSAWVEQKKRAKALEKIRGCVNA